MRNDYRTTHDIIFSVEGQPPRPCLHYCLGVQRDSLFAIDSENLTIWLDEAGRFQSCSVWSD